MGALKWDVVKLELEQSENKLEYVKTKLSNFDSESKYAPVFRYIGVQLLKYVLDSFKKTNRAEALQLTPIVLEVVEVLGMEQEVRNYVNNLAPHLILALANSTKSDMEVEYLCDIVEGLHPLVSSFGKQTTNNKVVGCLLKIVSKLNEGSERVFGCGVLYLPLCADTKPFSNIATNTLILLRDILPPQRGTYNHRFWELVMWCSEEQITARLPDLIFLLIQHNHEDGLLDITQADRALLSYSHHISLHSLSDLFQLVRDVTSLLTSSAPDLANVQLPSEGFLEMFSTSQKETIWILLAVCQHLSYCLLLVTSIPAAWLQLIFQMCKLMYRSPQDAVQEKSSQLLGHVHLRIEDLHSFLGSDEGFHTYTSLLMLTLQNLEKTSVTGEEFVKQMEKTMSLIESESGQIELLELWRHIPGEQVPEEYLLRLATLYRSQGHLSEAISILSDVSYPTASSSLLLVYCLLSKQDFEPAARVLTEIKCADTEIRSSVSVLLTYSNYVTSLKQREPFAFPNPIHFCQEARVILSGTSPDDCLLSVLMLLGGLYGVSRVVAQCAARLSPRPENLVSVLSAVPALLANRLRVVWSRDLEVLTDWESERQQIEDILDTQETDTQTERGRGGVMLRGLCGYVLIDRLLEAGEGVYVISEQCTSYSLQAVHTKLRSWKRTAMSTRALLWDNCSMIPYTLHVLSRYISLLFTWGSVHLTFSYLDRLEQLAKFSRSEYWIGRHRNLSAVVRVTLQTAAKVPAPVCPVSTGGAGECDRDDDFISEYLEAERYRTAETRVVISAAERSNKALPVNSTGDDGVGSGGDVEDGGYPVFSSSFSPRHLIKLTLLQLDLSWSIAPPSQESLVEYYHVIKRSRDSLSSSKTPSVPVELDKLSAAWLSLLADSQPERPDKMEESSKPKLKATVRRGRSRNNSASKTTTRRTATRQTTRKQTAKRQTAGKKAQTKKTESVDHVQTGLESCSGLEPVFVKRELLKRKIKRAPTWPDVEEYHDLPFKHQLLDVMKRCGNVTSTCDDVTIPENWTIASIMKIGGTLYVGQRTADNKVVFKRKLPFSLKSMGGDNISCLDEMRQIISSNDDSVTHCTDKVKFWNSRFQLNSRLEGLVKKLESDWLGPWQGLLLGRPVETAYRKQIRASANVLRKEIKSKHKVDVGVFLSEYVLDCYSVLSEEHITELLPDLPVPDLLDTIHELAPAAPPPRHPTLLTLGPDMDLLPWESCKVYQNQPISRVPSTSFALTLLSLRTLPVKLRKEKTFYILNPAQNLPSTQACFESWLSAQEGWRGVAAKPPSVPEYEAGLKSDMFLYLGHGSGKEFLGGKPIQELESRAVALLMGCSSGKIKQTPVGGTGTPVEYLLSGCPAVLGYLWNITDRDCDRFSKKLLGLWLAEGSSISLLSLINPSRDACKLPYLVGAAPVLYGVPDILTTTSGA